MFKKATSALVIALAATVITACGMMEEKKEAKAAPAPVETVELYEVHEEGRIYLFDRKDTYHEFLSVGETPFRLTRIGAGPKGETFVFGLHKDDKKKTSGIKHVDLTDGKMMVKGPFYGEMRAEGRIYVFSGYDDMLTVRQTGEAPLRYTDIGSGPKGETVVYVLNSGNKKHRPDALIAMFKKHNM